MDEERVEEHDVALLHLEVDLLALDLLPLPDAEVGPVSYTHLTLPTKA